MIFGPILSKTRKCLGEFTLYFLQNQNKLGFMTKNWISYEIVSSKSVALATRPLVHTLLNYYVLNSYTSFVRISAFTIAYTHSFVLFGTNIHCREQIIHNSKGPAFLVSCTKDECVGVESTPKFVCNYSQSSLQFSQSGFASAILLLNLQVLF